VPATGGEADVEQVTDLPLDLENLRWSPTGVTLRSISIIITFFFFFFFFFFFVFVFVFVFVFFFATVGVI